MKVKQISCQKLRFEVGGKGSHLAWQPFMTAWSNGCGSLAGYSVPVANSDNRVAAALRAETAWEQRMAVQAGSRAQSFSPSSAVSWMAEPFPGRSPSRRTSEKRQQWLPSQWTCGGKEGCGYKRSAGPRCDCCNAQWGHWRAPPVVGFEVRTANSFEALQNLHSGKGNGLGPSKVSQGPPWARTKAKLAGGGKNSSKDKEVDEVLGSSAEQLSPTSAGEEDENMLEEGQDQSGSTKVDIEKLKAAISHLESALGSKDKMVLQLKDQLAAELENKRRAVPPHLQLNKIQRKIDGLEAKLQKGLLALESAEAEVQKAVQKVQDIKTQCRAWEASQLACEQDKTLLVLAMGSDLGKGPGPSEEATNLQQQQQESLSAQMAKLLQAATKQIDSGDEKAHCLGEALTAAARQLEIYLGKVDVDLPVQEGKSDDKLVGHQQAGNSTPRPRQSSRSPRREVAAAAAVVAAAKAAGAIP